jgi:heme exporter protein A
MLGARALACERGARLLFRDLAFDLAPGRVLQVQGANGSGKTSLLRIVAGLLAPVAGEVLWRGRALGREARGAELFFLGHHDALKDDFNALENLRTHCRLAGEPASDQALSKALACFGLDSGRERLPARALSQGQRRRAALARLLLTRRRLWLLDEPAAALDAAACRLLAATLLWHLRNGGMALLTTHQPLLLPRATMQQLQLEGAA